MRPLDNGTRTRRSMSFAECLRQQRSAAESPSLSLSISIHLSELCLWTCTTPTVIKQDFNLMITTQISAGYIGLGCVYLCKNAFLCWVFFGCDVKYLRKFLFFFTLLYLSLWGFGNWSCHWNHTHKKGLRKKIIINTSTAKSSAMPPRPLISLPLHRRHITVWICLFNDMTWWRSLWLNTNTEPDSLEPSGYYCVSPRILIVP